MNSWWIPLIQLPIFCRVAAGTLEQPWSYHGNNEATLRDMGKIILPNHNKSQQEIRDTSLFNVAWSNKEQ